MFTSIRFNTAAIASLMFLAALAPAQGYTQSGGRQGGSAVQGAAGTDGAVGDNGLERCPTPMAAIAVVEPQDEIIYALRRYNLSSPVGLIRMMIQQSNCFIVVERGRGMQNVMQERQLAAAGESRQEGQRRQDEQGHAGQAPGGQARARTVIFVRHGRVGPRVEEVLKTGGSARASGDAYRT